jgi:hypothetical protein
MTTQHTAVTPGAIVRHAGADHRALWQSATGLVVVRLDRGHETGIREILVGSVEVCNG